jgi:hypothetical protein
MRFLMQRSRVYDMNEEHFGALFEYCWGSGSGLIESTMYLVTVITHRLELRPSERVTNFRGLSDLFNRATPHFISDIVYLLFCVVYIPLGIFDPVYNAVSDVAEVRVQKLRDAQKELKQQETEFSISYRDFLRSVVKLVGYHHQLIKRLELVTPRALFSTLFSEQMASIVSDMIIFATKD